MLPHRTFNRYVQLDGIDRLSEIFLQMGKRRIVNRNETFIHYGLKTETLAYVRSGAFRHLIPATNGVPKVAGYSFAGDLISSFQAFDEDVSAVSIQAIRQSMVYVLRKEELSEIMSSDLSLMIYKTALADVYGRLLLMHAGTPEERYVSLIAHYPAILEEVSLREIASYLRMAPETLSRIRRRISNEQKKIQQDKKS